jgi:spore photoproduct lyase
VDTIYIENDIATHPQTRRLLARYPAARHIPIERHTDVFNANSQNFRVQKQNPALILAAKHGRRVLATPPEYHIGGEHNYYFSHMLNCIYDCRYCFLQGMYRSGNYVVFVNFDDFFDDIATQEKKHDEPSWYFSGYDCDSLALEPLTGFVDLSLERFSQMPNAWLELRTKSTQIRSLLARPVVNNCVVAYSLSPDAIIKAEEHRTPSLAKRIAALQSLQRKGWRVGLRFDPILYADNFETLYGELFNTVFDALDCNAIHSVSLGTFRLPKPFFKKMVRLYPESRLLAAELDTTGRMVSYAADTESRMLKFCESRLLSRIRPDQFFPCVSISHA